MEDISFKMWVIDGGGGDRNNGNRGGEAQREKVCMGGKENVWATCRGEEGGEEAIGGMGIARGLGSKYGF